jgi:hypothetical protein
MHLFNWIFRFSVIGYLKYQNVITKDFNLTDITNIRILYKGHDYSGIKTTVESLVKKFPSSIKIEVINLDIIPRKNFSKKIDDNKIINFYVGNPEIIFKSFFYLRTSFFKSINIGLWFWELESFPAYWAVLNKHIDLTLVQSNFNYRILKKISRRIKKIPFGISHHYHFKKTKKTLKIPNNKFIFYFNFDFLSSIHRKNPFLLIKSFEKAFNTNDNCLLVIRSINGFLRVKDYLAFKKICDEHKNIFYVDKLLSKDESFEMLECTNCYISLHRSEGLGLNLANAMMQKKPVIATNYSGNLEFMNSTNSLLVGYNLIKIKTGEYFYANSKWAEANLDESANAMRKIFNNPKLANRLADKGYNDLVLFNTINKEFKISKQWLKKELR